MLINPYLSSEACEKQRLARLLKATDTKLENKMRAIEHLIDHSGQSATVKDELRKRVSDRFKNI